MSKTPLTPTRRRPVDEYPADRQNSPIVNGELDGSFLLRLVLCEAWFGGGVFVDFSGGPGGEQGEGVGGRRGWLRGVDGEGESRFGAQVEAFVGEFEVADDVVVEVLDPGAVGANNRSASPTASSDPGSSPCRTSSRADSAPARTSCSCAPSWLGVSAVESARRHGRASALADRGIFQQIANEHGVSPQQVCLAWELSLSPTVIPIPGASRPDSITDSARAADLELTTQQLHDLSGHRP